MNWKVPLELQQRQNPLNVWNARPNPIDTTENWKVDDALAIGIYDGTMTGMKLASALAFPVVSVPVSFMGLPTPVSTNDDNATQEALTQILEEATTFFQKIFILRRVVGTAWAFPNWNAKKGEIYHELIPNSSVVDIIKDIDTGEVNMIITEEQLTVQSGENRQSIVTRKRYFTRASIKIQYTGDVPPQLQNKTIRNTSGVMPIAFANDVIDNSVRGKTVYNRLLSHLKNFHDVTLKWSETLATFNVKWVQFVENNLDDFLKNNPGLLQADGSIDVNGIGFIIAKNGKEDTKFVFPDGSVTDAYKAMTDLIRGLVIDGSGVPEMAFGRVATGNHASAEEQMTTLANTVMDDQTQIAGPLHEYFEACLRLMAGATMQNLDPEFTIPWNDIEVVSQEVRAKIILSQSEALNKLDVNASLPLETKHKLSMMFWPKATEPDFEKWKLALGSAAKYKQFQTASLTDALDVGPGDFDA